MNFDYKDISFFDIEKKNLPTLPTIAVKLINIFNNNDSSMQMLSKVIENDPTISANILKIVNSAFYSLRKKIDSVKLALVVLGINEIRNIIFSLTLLKAFNKTEYKEIPFDTEMFWKHSSLVAHLSKFLAKKFRINTHGEEFTIGLLHDIGKLMIYEFLPEKTKEIIFIAQGSNCKEYISEYKVLGTTHFQIGAWISHKWKLPEIITESILYHHFPENSDNKKLTYIVLLSDLIANHHNFKQEYHTHKVKNDILETITTLNQLCKTNIIYEDLTKNIASEIKASTQFFDFIFNK